ncbi:MAG: RNA methyltransferase [Myxococcales bacterium]|nr:MAG: RNA methyltransferase [Myxococcales bacterium]
MHRFHPDSVSLGDVELLPASADDVIHVLRPLLSEERMQRIEQVINHRIGSVTAVLEDVFDPHNVAAVMRSAEAFGTQALHLVERGQDFKLSSRVAQGTQRWIDLQIHRDAKKCVSWLKRQGFKVLVADGNSDDGYDLNDLKYIKKVAMVFGNEHQGVSDELRQMADGSFAIGMRGFVESLNISVAAALSLYTVTSERSGDLDEESKAHLKARFMLASVDRGEEIIKEALSRGIYTNGKTQK